MESTAKVQAFIEHARSKGMDHPTIQLLLTSAGWKEKDIARAFADSSLTLPVPEPPDGGAREAFFHLLSFASLATAIGALVHLFFTAIERYFPDPAIDPSYISSDDWRVSGIRWSLSYLIVAAPIFLLLQRHILSELRRHPERAWSAIRRWLSYIILFFAACALFGDLITLVFYMLDGELTARFIAKVSVVLLLAGSIFSYYFIGLRLEPNEKHMQIFQRSFGIFAILVIALGLWSGFFFTGSPSNARMRNLDEKREQDLRAIHNAVLDLVHKKPVYGDTTYLPSLDAPLPKNIDDLVAKSEYMLSIADPSTNAPYEYSTSDALHFRLCATFDLPYEDAYLKVWNHAAGHQCFDFDARETRRY